MATIAKCVCEAVFDYVIASGIIVNQQSLIFGAMRATWRVGIIAAMTVAAFDHGDVIGGPLFLTIGAQQTDHRQVFTLTFNRMEGGIADGEFHSLIGGFHWQVGAFGVAQVA